MIAKLAAFGFVGWLVENAADRGPMHFSPWVPRGLPFIPAYALGGALLGGVKQVMRDQPLLQRAAAYAVTATTFELAACWFDRKFGQHTWDYGSGLCVDAKHTAAWTALALVAEPLL